MTKIPKGLNSTIYHPLVMTSMEIILTVNRLLIAAPLLAATLPFISPSCQTTVGSVFDKNSFLYEIVEKQRPNISSENINDIVYDEMTEANQALVDFPYVIPKVENIDKYMTPGAEYTLVHVRQMHKASGHKENHKREVVRVQDNIHSILSFLEEQEMITSVHGEGYTPEYAQGFYTGIEDGEIFDVNVEQLPQIEKRRQQPEIKKKWDHILYEDGATEFLAARGDLELLPAETKEVRRRLQNIEFAESLRSSYRSFTVCEYCVDENPIEIDPAVKDEIIMDEREDALLEIISGQECPLVVTTYGGDHAWGGHESFGHDYFFGDRPEMKDNIAEWNALHPDQMFSLIEITPERYVE